MTANITFDLLIRGGHVIDPAAGRNGIYDIGLLAGKVAAVAPQLPSEQALEVVEAGGLYVTPGLIDLHTHCYWGATYWGIEVDPVAARTGVTTWIDAGSAGAYSFSGFRRYVIEGSQARVLAFLNISSIGLIARTYELSNLEYCDVDIAATIVEANRDVIVGIKARIDCNTTRGTGLEPLVRARQLADRVGLPLMVHIGRAPPALRDIVRLMRPGDILTHCYTGQDNRLIDEQGRIYPFVRELRREGIILDLGHGSGSFSYAAAEAMVAADMAPDVISSDIHQLAVHGPMYDMPTTLSKFLNLGIPLHEVIARATRRPAAAIGQRDLGGLEIGSPGDIALFHLEEGDYTLYDSEMEPRRGTQKLVLQAAYAGGSLLRPTPPQPPAPWVTTDFPEKQRSILPPSLNSVAPGH